MAGLNRAINAGSTLCGAQLRALSPARVPWLEGQPTDSVSESARKAFGSHELRPVVPTWCRAYWRDLRVREPRNLRLEI